MRISSSTLLFLALAGCLPASRGATLHLTCNSLLSPQDEAKLIARLAPRQVKREKTHVLSVRTADGTLRFTDKAPYGEELSGVKYTFCDRKEGFTLLTLSDEDLFTGVLVNEASGKIGKAGEYVLLSPDRHAYLASEQPDGLDAKRWTIYAVDGKPSWSGYDYIPADNDEHMMTATLVEPAWTGTGELTASAACLANDAIRWNVKLTKIGAKWQWLPKRRCPVR
jgi:hypothetical protein